MRGSIENVMAVVDVLVFCKETGRIDFLGVHPQYRRKGVTKAFSSKLMTKYLPGGTNR
ncbi:GNAT family N-acetyltransferase [Marinisporobacter balticus]|uniref:Acetyltransferase (GNAT) family protein n=1 Tax=Marinisporobacter balticus TaxID=2018667 RepID=A0A4R2KNB1_9FIRM|nr:GNAT family N-acetyltransferase [Marinisporobacter balticus]TCO75193.1 hypothetical protein EV214_10924 [Marinisporobacter balticus]